MGNEWLNLLIQVPLVGAFFYGFFKMLDRFDAKDKAKDIQWQEAIKGMQNEMINFIKVRDERDSERQKQAVEVQKELIGQVRKLGNKFRK